VSDTSTGNQALIDAATALQAAEQVIERNEAAAPVLTPSAGLDAWVDTLRNTAIARDTAAWNRIYAATQEIRAAIAAVKEI
jgi:hypothetical protein